MDVGIRELKAHLSHYVKRASRGETIRVTDRGRTAAVLTPPTQDLELPEGLARGIREGWITSAQSRGPLAEYFPTATLPAGETSLQIIQEDREDR
ncbi:MAG: type II toxin-antitoxin system prevent-host-death family antitoxin [Actinomycetota bacterium]|nr:type II toxin-antitoxin system prevent-host-death family antitoxin [Actinomycetota bacterium]